MMATVETTTNMNDSRTTSFKTTGLRETESVDGKEKNSTRPPLVAQAEDKSQNRIRPRVYEPNEDTADAAARPKKTVRAWPVDPRFHGAATKKYNLQPQIRPRTDGEPLSPWFKQQ